MEKNMETFYNGFYTDCYRDAVLHSKLTKGQAGGPRVVWAFGSGS